MEREETTGAVEPWQEDKVNLTGWNLGKKRDQDVFIEWKEGRPKRKHKVKGPEAETCPQGEG